MFGTIWSLKFFLSIFFSLRNSRQTTRSMCTCLTMPCLDGFYYKLLWNVELCTGLTYRVRRAKSMKEYNVILSLLSGYLVIIVLFRHINIMFQMLKSFLLNAYIKTSIIRSFFSLPPFLDLIYFLI